MPIDLTAEPIDSSVTWPSPERMAEFWRIGAGQTAETQSMPPGLEPPKDPTGVKFDDGKTRYDLLPAYPLEMLALIYTFGARKYEDNNWRKGLRWGRVFAAVMRHLWAFWQGEDLDPESGLPHLAHAAWGLFTLMEYGVTHPELDDRSR